MIGWLRRLNDSLPGLVLGIIIYAVIIEIPVLIFAPEKLMFTIGLWYGAAIAVGTAVNLASVIYDSVAFGDAGYAQKKAVLKSLLRYAAITVLFLLIGFLKFGNLYMSLIGMLGLKISAYMQPLMGIISRKLFGDNWMYPADTEESSAEEKNAAEETADAGTTET